MNIPSDIKTRFDTLLVKKQIPALRHNNYRKWLRHYLDFCQKHHHSVSKKESPAHFIEKLQDKNQPQERRKQASHAISLYLTLILSAPERQEETASAKKASGWNAACDNLKAEIKARHYSPKTLSAYTNWVRKFQGFTRNKEIQSLSSYDYEIFSGQTESGCVNSKPGF